MEQCFLFPTGDRDDLFDALVYGLHMIMKYSRKTSVFKDKSAQLKPIVNSFVVKDNRIPCFAPAPGTYKTEGRDWRI